MNFTQKQKTFADLFIGGLHLKALYGFLVLAELVTPSYIGFFDKMPPFFSPYTGATQFFVPEFPHLLTESSTYVADYFPNASHM